ncbi:PD-(D/E)XK nuclease family protein [Blastococcus sp. Marseille-P5729]|uniref:RecB family exonuclease n=1 Tax=Blastococcus sp. Marseille-P5729 TaxID=2086582 RepID=UPI0018FEAC56|nr:PD-(D/E)XK nuclease family protein [Blastococcus sp. Marseille-P5729]
MSAAEQLGLDGMPAPLRQVTPAKLDTFDSCPRRFRYAYLDRPTPARGAPWAHTGIGSAVHAALRAIWDTPPSRRSVESVIADLRAMWPAAGFRDAAQSQRALRIVSGQLAQYVAEQVDLRTQPRGIERTVGAPYGDLAISGRIDRVDELDDGSLVVIDYKTGRAVPTDHEARASMQLAVYAVAVERTFRARCARVELHHIPSGTIAAAEITSETRQRQMRRAASTADDMDRARRELAAGADPDVAYPARVSPACGHCDFWAHCREGRQIRLKDPWFAVPGENATMPTERPT